MCNVNVCVRDIRFGSLADITASNHDVRFTPESRHTRLTQLESECSEDYHSPQSGHGLSDRDGSHVRVDGRVDLVRAVCGRPDPFGSRNGSTVRRRMSDLNLKRNSPVYGDFSCAGSVEE